MVGGGGNANEAAGRLGLPMDLIGEAEQFKNSDGIYPDNAQIVDLFCRVMTQWLYYPNGKPSGLNYPSLELPMRIMRISQDDERDVFDGIRVMELAALKVIRER